jgi:hypothetical protein
MALGQLAGGIATLVGVGDPEVRPRSLGRELRALMAQQPTLLRSLAGFGPAYQDLALLQQESALFGNEAVGDASLSFQRAPGRAAVPAGWRGSRYESGTAAKPGRVIGATVTGGPQGGLFGLYDRANQRATQQYLDSIEGQRRGEMDLLTELGPLLRESQRSSDPAFYDSLNELLSGARADYGAGGNINPSDQRWLSQQAAGEWSSRGLGGSPAAALDALSKSFGFSENLRNARQGRLTGALGTYSAGAGTPYDLLFGRPAGQMTAPFLNSAASLQAGAGQSSNPMGISQYGGNVFDYNANADAFNRITEANNRIAGITSTGKGVTSLLSMGFGGGMGGMMGGAGGAGGAGGMMGMMGGMGGGGGGFTMQNWNVLREAGR